MNSYQEYPSSLDDTNDGESEEDLCHSDAYYSYEDESQIPYENSHETSYEPIEEEEDRSGTLQIVEDQHKDQSVDETKEREVDEECSHKISNKDK